MPDSPEPTLDSEAATLPLSGPRPTLSAGNNIDLPLPEELTKLLPPGAYEVTRFLGAGGMGAVYQGMQVRLKRPVAIKIMRRDMGRDQDFEARFEREAQAMAKLNHPNIVSVIDYGEAGADYLYIVMELIDGADMMDVIRGGQMTQEMALSLLPQICDALQFAHDHGIVHRDIKPSNIMLTRDGRIKMADFGLAKHFDAESSFRTQTGTGMGTPDYAAPEQFSPNSPIDHRADIYALGVMIYQMITGQLPRGVWKPPSQRAEVAPQWDAIVSRAMQSDPIDRYQQASEVKTAVSTIPLSGKDGSAGTLVSPASSGVTAAKNDEADKSVRAPVKFRAPLFIGLITGAVVIAIGAFFALKKPTETSPPTPSTRVVTSSPPVAEPWVRVWNSPEGLSNAVTLVDGWVVSKTGGTTLGGTLLYPMQWHDSAIRSEWKWSGGPSSGSIGGHISIREAGKHRYKLSRNKKAVLLHRTDDDNATVLLQEHPVGEPKEGETFTLELRAVGTALTAKLDGKEIIRVKDDKLTTGGPAVYVFEKGGMRNIEVLNLDKPTVAVVSPTPSPQAPKSSITAPALPESGWKPLWTEKEWKAKPGFKNGQLNLSHARATKPQTWSDGAIRARIEYQGGTKSPSLVARKTGGSDGFYYRFGVGSDGKHIYLSHLTLKPDDNFDMLGRYFLSAPLKPNDVLLLELRVQGDRLVGLLDGKVIIEAQDTHLRAPGEWGIIADEGWFESVEVQPLPAAVAGIKLWDTPEKLPRQKGLSWENGALRLDATTISYSNTTNRDVAFRATALVGSDQAGGVSLFVHHIPQKGNYALSLNGNAAEIRIAASGQPTRVLAKWPLARSYRPDEWVRLEIRAEGARLTALVDGQILGSVEDRTLTGTDRAQGGVSIAVVRTGYFKDIEYVPLDAPAVSPTPSLPVSASWKNALADSAQLRLSNGAEITPEGLLLTGISSAISVYAGQKRGDGAIRLRATADGLRQGIRARVDEKGGHYKLDIANQTTLKLHRWDNVARQSTLLREFPLPSSFNLMAEHEVELRAEGSTLTVSLDRQTLGTVTDAVLKSGTFGVSVGLPITKPVLIKTLEVLDLGTAVSPSPNLSVTKSSVLTFNGHRYQLITTPSTWAEAKANAEAMGGHLATFTTEAEERWARETILQPLSAQESASTKAPDNLYWIGGSAAAQSKDFRWLSGEAVGKIGWRSGNPGWRERADMPETKAVGTLFAAALVVERPRSNGEWISVQQQSLKRAGFISEWDDAGGTSSVAPSPNLPVSASSPQFPPGQWVKLFTKPEDLPADLRKPDSGVTWEDGWIRISGTERKVINLPSALRKNAGVRMRVKRGSDQSGHASIALRNTPGPESRYVLSLFDSGFYIDRFERGQKNQIVSERPPALRSGDEYTMEFAAIGSRLVGRAPDAFARVIQDRAFEDGAAYVSSKEDLRDIEVINLDGLPEAEALRLLGVDEQGNDLRGKSVATEAWENLLSDPAKLRLARQAVLKADGLHMGEESAVIRSLNFSTQRDGAVRLRANFGELRAAIRVRSFNGKGYQLYTSSADVITLHRASDSGSSQTIENFRPKKPFQPGQEYELELRVEGRNLTAKLDGDVLGTVSDDTFTQGNFGVAAAGKGSEALVKSLEFLDLDKPVSPSPNLPISKSSDPKFPPGQWVKLFTKPEDLPADLRKPDSGVKWEDGWIRGLKVGQVLSLPNSLSGNYAIRLRSIAQKVATGDGVVVRRQEPGDQAKRGHFQSKYGGGKFLIQQMVRGNYQTLHSVTPPEAPTDGQDYSLEVGVVGKRLVSRLNSTSATTVMGDGFTRGKGFIDLSTPLHDIEVINLDGLPEAEALRLLGVDEKGNDLRGKSGAKSPDGVKSIPRLTRLTWTGPKLSAEMEAARKEGGRLRLWGTFKDSIPLPTTHQEFNSTDFVRVAGDGDVLFALTKSQRGVGMRLLDGKPKVYAKSGTDALTCGRRAAMLGAGRTALSFDEGAAHAFLGRPSAILAMKHSGAIFSMSAKAEVEWGVHRGIPSETPPSVESIPKNLVAAVGNAHGIAFLEDTGHVSYWNTRRGLDVRRMDELTDIVEIDGGENHLIALRADGRVVVVGIEAFSQPPANLPPAVAVRASIYGCAAQLADGTWIAWGPDAAVNEKVRGIGPAIDLELDHCRAGSKSKDAGYVAWIEPLPTAPKGGTVGGAGTDNPLAASIIAATKDAPFVNTLGMKFVPVPITGGPTDKQRVLFSVWETRVQDYEVFVKETKREWAMSKFEQGPTHPAVMVSWDDAAAFCVWLTERERKAGKLGANEHYRLPSDHEWSCAAGIGDKEDASTVPIQKSSKLIDRFSWGSTWPPVSAVENFSGLETDGHKTWEGQQIIAGYKDVFPTTAPVGSFAASPAGLFDTGGNVREWCLDDHDADKQTKVWRGASFRDSQRSALELSYRSGLLGSNRDEMYGFRVVLAPTKLDQP
jgi:serine/threonine protein kinase